MGDPPKRAAWVRYTDAASVGLEIVVAVTVCTLGARWLEQNVTHWAPWTTMIGIFVGLGAAAKAIVRTARNYTRELRRDAEEAAAREAEEASKGAGDP